MKELHRSSTYTKEFSSRWLLRKCAESMQQKIFKKYKHWGPTKKRALGKATGNKEELRCHRCSESRETSHYYVLSALNFDASALTALIRSQQNRMHLVPLSLIQCSLLLTFDRANWERNTRSAGRGKNHAVGEIWKYLCERSETSNTKNHKKWEAIWSH